VSGPGSPDIEGRDVARERVDEGGVGSTPTPIPVDSAAHPSNLADGLRPQALRVILRLGALSSCWMKSSACALPPVLSERPSQTNYSS